MSRAKRTDPRHWGAQISQEKPRSLVDTGAPCMHPGSFTGGWIPSQLGRGRDPHLGSGVSGSKPMLNSERTRLITKVVPHGEIR